MELALPHWHFFDKYTDKKREDLTDAQVGERIEEERRLFCATCRSLITTQDDRISIQGGAGTYVYESPWLPVSYRLFS